MMLTKNETRELVLRFLRSERDKRARDSLWVAFDAWAVASRCLRPLTVDQARAALIWLANRDQIVRRGPCRYSGRQIYSAIRYE